MKDRRETAEMAVMAGARRGEGPKAYSLQYVEGPSPEYARQGGQMRGRSRCFMTGPG
jgi:hypothetical protein